MNLEVVGLYVLLFLGQKAIIAQSKNCRTGSSEPCDIYFSWKGCYDLSNKLESSYELALGYEELFRDTPKKNDNFTIWQSRFTNSLFCRCATEAAKLDYNYFALQLYSVCYGGSHLSISAKKSNQFCFEVNAARCSQSNQSMCFRVGNNGGIAIYGIVPKSSTLPYAQCYGNKLVEEGRLINKVIMKSAPYKAAGNKNETEDSKAALRRMFKELDACYDINQILEIIRKIIGVFGRQEIYESFDVFTDLQESFIGTLSKIVGDSFKHLWKETPKVQYLVEMVQEMSVLTLRSLSFTNKTNYTLQTPNIDILANLSHNGDSSLYFNETTSDTSIIFDNSFQRISSKPASTAAILYKTINDIFPAIMNHEKHKSPNTTLSSVVSPVVSIVSMQDGKLIKQINGTIRLKKMINEKQKPLEVLANHSCVYWKEHPSLSFGGAWSSVGLSTDSFHDNSTDYFTCHTSHLTSFSVLMQVTEFEIPREHQYALQAITYTGCSLSLLCLLIAIVSIPIMRLKETRFMIHLHLCIALAVSQALFLAGIAAIKNKTACMVIAMVLHYFYTAAFMLMLVEGIHLYQKVVIAYEVKTIKQRMYFLFAWGFPSVIVGIAFAANREGYGTNRGCWLSLEKGFRWAFITPVIVVLLANIVILIRVLMVMVSLQADPLRPEKYGKIRLACKGVAILLPLLGLTWFFGLMSVNSDTIAFQYLFAILNSLQGVFIFVLNYVSNKEVRMSFRRTIHRSQITSLL